jgi:hypothetical protein
MKDDELRPLLRQLPSGARDALRRTLIAVPQYRNEVSARLLREGGESMADLIDMLTLNPNAGRQVVRLLGELEASLER